MNDRAMRSWCAVIQYPGKEPILFGTTTARRDAQTQEVESALSADIAKCLPSGWRLINMVAGAIHFVPETADE